MTDRDVIGPRLRELRMERSLSLTAVSEATEISTSFLSAVETGKSDISFARLGRLLRFYGVDFTAITEHEQSPVVDADSDVLVVRRGQHGPVPSPREGLSMVPLAPHERQGLLSPFIRTFDVGAGNREPAQHAGEEFVYVLEGTLALTVGDARPVILDAGDCASFSADHPHMYRNVGRAPAKTLTVVANARDEQSADGADASADACAV